MDAALTAARLTDGDVDPTVGAAIVALGYDADIAEVRRAAHTVPAFTTAAHWSMIALDGRMITTPPGVLLDLGATAKAVAADRCAQRIHTVTGSGVLVNLGGDIATAGSTPEGGWQVLVQDTAAEPASSIALPSGAALATSSTLRRRWRNGDELMHHIIDPQDGAFRRSGVADGQRRGAHVFRRQHRRHRRHRSGQARPGVDRQSRDGRSARRRTPRRPHRWCVAAVPRRGSVMSDQALWALGRGTGITALAFLTLSLGLGIATRSGRPLAALPRFAVADVHRVAALAGTLLIALHLGLLFFDPYAQLRLLDFVIPFLGAYRPLWLGLGTLAFDVLVVVIVSSLLRHRLGLRTFRVVHWVTYALWPLALAHALGNGTDAGHTWFLAFAACCGLTVAAALTWRLRADFVEYSDKRIVEHR